MSVLKYGSIGNSVLTLQKAYKALGYSILTDGEFFKETRAVTSQFEVDHGLAVNGQAGPDVQALLAKLINVQNGVTPTIPHPSDSSMPWLSWMKSHIGEIEKTGAKATAFDKEVFSHTDYGPLDGGIMDEGCAATACAALEETGFQSPHSARALDFHNYGTKIGLIPGCIVVFQWASGGHHVSFCDHIVDDGSVACLGGNQSSSVKVSTFPISSIIATRWPVK